ncbi:MAG: hypothetical protein A3E84_00115 [Gammaproteobacteria bacterium RIFCSPHIGHO2_12_FULL_42_13]|nr:MAG: hypothetical protein A3E84_00115 [Gammaproteobacteria bacterium RIFCSPHIGHO2_12_FULL_42_13]
MHEKSENEKLVMLLLAQEIFSENTLMKMVSEALRRSQTLFQYCIQRGECDPKKWLEICLNQQALSIEEESASTCSQKIIEAMPVSLFKTKFLLPISVSEDTLNIAICNPIDLILKKTLSQKINKSIVFMWKRYDHLINAHNHLINSIEYTLWKEKETAQAQEIIQHIISDGIQRRASDIHIEPYEKSLRIRFRIDGILHEIIRLEKKYTENIINCVKVMTKLDITITRVPQDGRFTAKSFLGFVKDCRISSYPTQHGEKIVIRLLEESTKKINIDALGLSHHNKKIMLDSIKKPQGLIILTGPTGSGKTITLYSLLNLLNRPEKNIVSLEDPIEVQIEGINQTPIVTQNGVTFSTMLRALLRQDPDVVMIGEIRDSETAEIAVRAAQTGHLVLSTLHTNTALEAISRLQLMGVAPYHLSLSLSLVVAQRLVRRLCHYCAIPYLPSQSVLQKFVFKKNDRVDKSIKQASKGCAHCAEGYQGRVGVFELIVINEAIKRLLFHENNFEQLFKYYQKNKHQTLWQAALIKVKQGVTSLDEVYRVVPEV